MKKKRGRPSIYSDAIADKLCNLIACSSKGLHHICKNNDDLPSFPVIFTWLSDPNKKYFQDKYARAREDQANFLADEIIDIADDSRNDTQLDEEGREVVNHDNIQRSRLRVDARKWKASKLAPKKYGDKVEVSGDKENPLHVITGMTIL